MTEKQPRRRATTEIGRQILQRERQRLAREAATLGEAMANEARAAMNARTWERATVSPERAAISRGIVRRVGAVLASEGVNVPLHVRPTAGDADSMKAWTDFRKIDVTYKDYADKRLVAAVLRGLIYHEGGHCRFSDPYTELRKQAQAAGADTTGYDYMHRAWNCLEDQRMETAVVSDSPRKAAYLTPMIMTEHVRTLDAMAANYPLLVWRRYLPRAMRAQARKMFIVRHADKGGEVIATELEAVVTSYVTATDPITMWTAVRAFHKLLERMHPLASNMSDAGHRQQTYGGRSRKIEDLDDFLTIPISPDMLDDDITGDPGPAGDEDDEPIEEDEGPQSSADLTDDEIEHLVEILIAAWNAPETLVQVRYVIDMPEPQQGEGESGPGSLLDEPETGEEQGNPGGSKEEGSKEEEGDPTAAGAGTDDGDDEDDDSDIEGDLDGEEDDKHEGGGAGTHTDDGRDNVEEDEPESEPFTQDDLDELLQEAEEDMLSQHELDGDMEAFSREGVNQTSKLDVYVGGVSNDGESITRAEMLAENIEQSFTASTMDRAPAWVEQQRRGVLNVQRYVTRQPGDVEVFRQWTEDDAPGYDIAVSILLDYSSSMGHMTNELAECGFAAKQACDRIGIPCTVTLWDTSARVLFDANERAEYLPVLDATGGTDPTAALADLDNQRCDRPKHIVLIMTDGDWSEGWASAPSPWSSRKAKKTTRHLAAYKDAGRVIVGFGYGDQHLAAGLVMKGCDEAFSIENLMEIPNHLERILLRMA